MKSETADSPKSRKESWTDRNKPDLKSVIGITEAAQRQHNKKLRATIWSIEGKVNSEE